MGFYSLIDILSFVFEAEYVEGAISVSFRILHYNNIHVHYNIFQSLLANGAENLVMSGKFSRSIRTETIIWNYFFGIYFSIHMMTKAMRAENMTLTEYVRMTSLLLQRCDSKDYRTFTVQSFVLHQTL